VEQFLRDAHTRNKRKPEGAKKKDKKKKRGKTKEIVDPTKPKGPKGPYLCFVSIRRPDLRKEKPKLSFQDIARELGAEWRSMSEENRVKYEAMAAADKERYEREMEAHVPLTEEQMNALRQEQKKRKAAGGLLVMYVCSPQLRTFLGGVKEINRKDLTTKIWAYFREKNLMDPINRRYILANAELAKLLGLADGERFMGFTVAQYLNKHLVKKN
jgi:chromatin remodeling complex protein RSC6